MKAKITKLTAAAAIIIAVTVGLTTILENGATPAYAIEHTIKAIQDIPIVHILGRDRQGKQIEMWVQVSSDTGLMKYCYINHVDDEKLMVSTPQNTYYYDKTTNTVRIKDGPSVSSIFRLGKFFEDMKLLTDRFNGRITHNEVYEPYTKRNVIELKITSLELEVRSLIDPQTKLPISVDVIKGEKLSYSEILKHADKIYYDDLPPEGLFDFTIPLGATIVNETIENYVNKVFCLGANDDHGDLIYTINGDLTKQNEMQYVCGGTGVYGLVHRNSAMNGHDYYICEASTDQDTVYYTAHNMKVGDFFWNVTRDAYSYVTIILSADHFQCEEISGQTAGDTLEVYREVNDVGTNILKRQYTLPQNIEFKSHATEFEPSSRLTVSIADMGLDDVYNIDEVIIKELSKTAFETTIRAVRRTNENFSTQKDPTYLDYFRGF